MLIPEHLRLGTWDLLKGWSGAGDSDIAPRLALQLVHESAVCATGIRRGRSLGQKGFELANRLPFIATDTAIHQLLDKHSIADAQQLQGTLGKLQRTHGDYEGNLLIIDSHHLRSYTQRQTLKYKHKEDEKAVKTLQTYFCLDADTQQPLSFIIASASRTVTQDAPELLRLSCAMVDTKNKRPLVLADREHFCANLFETAHQRGMDLLVPQPLYPKEKQAIMDLPTDSFTRRWAGLATAIRPFNFHQATTSMNLYQMRRNPGELRL